MEGKGKRKVKASQTAVSVPQTPSTISTEKGAAGDSTPHTEQKTPSPSIAQGGKGNVVADFPG